jgi:branched-chain amino acid transport system substrate-binding protein
MIRAVATADGEVIEPGEWAKAKRLIAAHQAINYNGAAGEHEFDGNGDVAGVIGHYIVEGNKYKEIDILK